LLLLLDACMPWKWPTLGARSVSRSPKSPWCRGSELWPLRSLHRLRFLLQAPTDAEALSQLKEEGNSLFAKKEYEKAVDAWERAIKVSAGNKSEVALLHSNIAACHMMHKK
jgi:hypothetical protein